MLGLSGGRSIPSAILHSKRKKTKMKNLPRVLLSDIFLALIYSHRLPSSQSIYIKIDLVLWQNGDTRPNSSSTRSGASWVVWTQTRNVVQNLGCPERARIVTLDWGQQKAAKVTTELEHIMEKVERAGFVQALRKEGFGRTSLLSSTT